jgi:hypothetical protein
MVERHCPDNVKAARKAAEATAHDEAEQEEQAAAAAADPQLALPPAQPESPAPTDRTAPVAQ